jgi:hypothetical protein
MMAGMGNAGRVLDAAFQDDKAAGGAPVIAAQGEAAPPVPTAQAPFRSPGAGDSATSSGA